MVLGTVAKVIGPQAALAGSAAIGGGLMLLLAATVARRDFVASPLRGNTG
jgi:hypothetical protein